VAFIVKSGVLCGGFNAGSWARDLSLTVLPQLLENAPQELCPFVVQFTPEPSVAPPRCRVGMSCVVAWGHLNDAFIQIPQLFFQLTDLVLQVEQHAMVEVLEFPVHGHDSPGLAKAATFLGRFA
jgi:hypothetical protein